MGIRLLYRMMNVSRLYAKLVEMSPAQTHNIHLFSFTLHVRINPNSHNCKELQLQLVKCGISVCVCVCILTGAGQVPAGIFSVLSVPDGCAHRAHQGHDQQDAEQDQDLHVSHPLHVRALQWCLGGVLGRWTGQ